MPRDSVGVVGRNENGGTFPVFAQAWYIAKNERTPRQGRFQDRQSERLIFRGKTVDGCARIPCGQLASTQITEQVQLAEFCPPAIRMTLVTGNIYGPVHGRANLRERRDVLRLIPYPASGKDQRLFAFLRVGIG